MPRTLTLWGALCLMLVLTAHPTWAQETTEKPLQGTVQAPAETEDPEALVAPVAQPSPKIGSSGSSSEGAAAQPTDTDEKEAVKGDPVLTAKEPSQGGATYFAHEGGDLGKLLERKHPKDAVGQFEIQVDELPQQSAQLSISAFDLDEERGETNVIFFNGTELGRLSGTNNAWNTTVFDVPLDLVKQGANEIRFEIRDSSRFGTINWSGKVASGQILIDGGAGDAGQIVLLGGTEQAAEKRYQGRPTLNLLKPGDFQLETTLIDPQGNALDAKTENFEVKATGEMTRQVPLAFDPKLASGKYKMVVSLFYKEGEFWLLQNSKNHPFEHLSSALSIVAAQPAPTLKLTEDDPASLQDPASWFGVQGGEAPEGLEFDYKVLGIEPAGLLLSKVTDGKLELTPLKDKNGTATVKLEARLGASKALQQVSVQIEPVDDAPKVLPPSDITVLLGAEPMTFDLHQVFSDLDNPPEEMTFEVKLNGGEGPEVVQAALEGSKLTLSFSDLNPGQAKVQLTAQSGGQEVSASFLAAVNPPDAVRQAKTPETLKLLEDSGAVTFSLAGLFVDDKASKEQPIELAVEQVKQADKLSALIQGNSLTLTPAPDQFGPTEVVIKATSRGQFATATLPVEVEPVDDAPSVVGSLPEVELNDEAPYRDISLVGLFGDVDNEDADISFKIAQNDRQDLLKARIDGAVLQLAAGEGRSDFATVTLEGTSNGKSAEYPYKVLVDLGEPWEFYAFGTGGVQRITNYGSSLAFGGGLGVELGRIFKGLKAEAEFTQSAQYTKSSTSALGNPYTTTLTYRTVALFAGLNLQAPNWLLQSAPWLKGYEINLRAGSALAIQQLRSTPDDSTKATANEDVYSTSTAIATGGGLAYRFANGLVADFGLTQYGSDVSLLYGRVRYHF